MTIHPGDQVQGIHAAASYRVPDEATARWLTANRWAVRCHWPRGSLRC